MRIWDTDFSFSNHGSVWLCTCHNEQARAHLAANVQEGAIWWRRDALGVEARYVPDLVEALQDAGFTTRLEE